MNSARPILQSLAAATLALLLTAASTAQEESNKAITFGIAIENDTFSGTDQNYTNGTELSWDFANGKTYSDIQGLPNWAKKLGQLKDGGRATETYGATISFGQKIFTPANKKATELLVEDRPYAGWTYLSLALRENRNNRTDTLEFTVGIVGPDSYAEEIQNWVHEKIGSQEAMGWDNQLKNEAGGILSWQRDTRVLSFPDKANAWGADLNTTFGVSLGNIHTHGVVGANLRLGYNRGAAGSSPRILPGNTSAFPSNPDDPRLSSDRSEIGFFLTVGAEGRYVARNIFIEGNTWADSHGLDLENEVGDYYAGLTFVASKWSLSYLYTVRSEEFPGQDEPHEFGGLTATRTF